MWLTFGCHRRHHRRRVHHQQHRRVHHHHHQRDPLQIEPPPLPARDPRGIDPPSPCQRRLRRHHHRWLHRIHDGDPRRDRCATPPPKPEAQLCVNLTLVDSYIGLSCAATATPVSGSSTNDYADTDDSIEGLCNPDDAEDEVALQPPQARLDDPKPLSGRHHHTLEQSVDDLAYSVCPAAVTSDTLDGEEAPVVVNSDVVLDALMLKAVSCHNALLSAPQVLLLTLQQHDPGPALDPPTARSRSYYQPTLRRSGQEVVAKDMDAIVLASPSSTSMAPARCSTKFVQLEVDAAAAYVVANNFKSKASADFSVHIPEHTPATPVSLDIDVFPSDMNAGAPATCLQKSLSHISVITTSAGVLVSGLSTFPTMLPDVLTLSLMPSRLLQQVCAFHARQVLDEIPRSAVTFSGYNFSSSATGNVSTAALVSPTNKEFEGWSLPDQYVLDAYCTPTIILAEGMFDALVNKANGRRYLDTKASVLIVLDSRKEEELKLQQLIVQSALEGYDFLYESHMQWDPGILKAERVILNKPGEGLSAYLDAVDKLRNVEYCFNSKRNGITNENVLKCVDELLSKVAAGLENDFRKFLSKCSKPVELEYIINSLPSSEQRLPHGNISAGSINTSSKDSCCSLIHENAAYTLTTLIDPRCIPLLATLLVQKSVQLGCPRPFLKIYREVRGSTLELTLSTSELNMLQVKKCRTPRLRDWVPKLLGGPNFTELG